jgi:hypothetical protein
MNGNGERSDAEIREVRADLESRADAATPAARSLIAACDAYLAPET